MLIELFYELFKEFKEICLKYNLQLPLWEYIFTQFYEICSQFPSGITKTILFTELDCRWRNILKRGENSGKIQQLLSTKQILSSDIILGTINPIDQHRWKIVSEGTSIQLIVPRQFKNWLSFCEQHQFNFLTSQDPELKSIPQLILTNCNLMNCPSYPLLLLPSPLAIFLISSTLEKDQTLLNSLIPLHLQMIDTIKLSLISPKKQIDDTKVTGVYAIIKEISDIMEYPTRSANCYRTIKLLILENFQLNHDNYNSFVLSDYSSPSPSSSPSSTALSIYLVLYNDQVHLTRLLSKNDLIFIYRPFIEYNLEEEAIFGTSSINMNLTGRIREVHRLADHLDKSTLSKSNLHYLYGSSTVILKITSNLSSSSTTTTTTSSTSTTTTISTVSFNTNNNNTNSTTTANITTNFEPIVTNLTDPPQLTSTFLNSLVATDQSGYIPSKPRMSILGRIIQIEETNDLSGSYKGPKVGNIARAITILPYSLIHGCVDNSLRCRIYLSIDSSDQIILSTLTQLCYGQILFLTSLQFEYISLSPFSTSTSSSYTILNFTSFVSSRIVSDSITSSILVFSKLMCICSSTTLLPPKSVNEILNSNLNNEFHSSGYLKVFGRLIKLNPNKKRDHLDFLISSFSTTKSSPEDNNILLHLIDPLCNISNISSNLTINSLNCLITPHTISSSQYNFQYYYNIHNSLPSSSSSSSSHQNRNHNNHNNNIVVVGLSYWNNHQQNEYERNDHKVFRIECISDYFLE